MNDFGFTFGIKISTFKFHSSFLKFKFPNQISILILWTRKIVFCFSNRRFDFHFLAHRIYAIATSIARWLTSKQNLTDRQNNKQSRTNLAKNCFGYIHIPIESQRLKLALICWLFMQILHAFSFSCVHIYQSIDGCDDICSPIPLLNVSIALLYVLVKHKFYLSQSVRRHKQ